MFNILFNSSIYSDSYFQLERERVNYSDLTVTGMIWNDASDSGNSPKVVKDSPQKNPGASGIPLINP